MFRDKYLSFFRVRITIRAFTARSANYIVIKIVTGLRGLVLISP